jgi:hypothetical protein
MSASMPGWRMRGIWEYDSRTWAPANSRGPDACTPASARPLGIGRFRREGHMLSSLRFPP